MDFGPLAETFCRSLLASQLKHQNPIRMPVTTLADILQTVPHLIEQCCDACDTNALRQLRLLDKSTREAMVLGIKGCTVTIGAGPEAKASSRPLIKMLNGAQLSKLCVNVTGNDDGGCGTIYRCVAETT